MLCKLNGPKTSHIRLSYNSGCEAILILPLGSARLVRHDRCNWCVWSCHATFEHANGQMREQECEFGNSVTSREYSLSISDSGFEALLAFANSSSKISFSLSAGHMMRVCSHSRCPSPCGQTCQNNTSAGVVSDFLNMQDLVMDKNVHASTPRSFAVCRKDSFCTVSLHNERRTAVTGVRHTGWSTNKITVSSERDNDEID